MKKEIGGFTLIELLVVVLIIGILASVALPQYQFAVIKSHVATVLTWGKTLKEAKEVFYLENNEYVRDATMLGVDLPSSCSLNSGKYPGYYKCSNRFILDNNQYNVTISYCPGYTNTWEDCYPKRDFSIILHQDHVPEDYWGEAGKIYCNVHHGSSLGKSVCKRFREFTYIERN